MDVMSEAEIILNMKHDAEAITAITQCSWCGKYMPDGGEVGCIDDGVAYSFCSYDCLGSFNIDQGLQPNGEIIKP